MQKVFNIQNYSTTDMLHRTPCMRILKYNDIRKTELRKVKPMNRYKIKYF